ncbi:MAG: cold-shock protein [Actinobacteria bacterium]|nr:cold-shock protein [Actinomycetota bacterium]
MNGKVVEFDDHTGLGTVEDQDGTRLSFHCTAIADGSRTVKRNAKVRFEIAPGNCGVWEAAAVEKA